MKNTISHVLKGTKIIITFFIVFTLVSTIIQSCLNDDIYELEPNENVTQNLNLFRQSITSASAKIKESSINRKNEAVIFEEAIRPSALDLIKSYGFTDQEILNEFGSFENPEISVNAALILHSEDLLKNKQTLNILSPDDYHYLSLLSAVGGNSLYAQSDTVGGCLLDALGISAIGDVLSGRIKQLGKKGVLKIIRKVAGKSLGPIGAVLAVYDFSDCMGWL